MTLKTTKLRDAISFALAVGAIAGSGAAFAQDAAAPETPTDIDRITVTGSRIRQVDAETSSPILTMDREQIEATGLTSVGDVLFNITASDGGALRNITTGTNGSDGTQQISLRGLGATRTLVLVNGRRWLTQGDGTVDLNTIPISVVERIEVLKDGASAIYGSDAIAGVINVITRKNFEGGEARAYLGQYSKGDGFQQAYDFTLGSSTEKVNTVFSISYTKQEPVYAGNRERSSVPVFGGGDLASGGLFGSGSTERGNFVRCAGAYTPTPTGFRTCAAVTAPAGSLPGGTSRTGTTLKPGEDGRQATDFRPFVSYTTDGSGHTDRYNFSPVNYLLQPIERFNMYGQGTLQLTDSITANIQATYVKRTSDQQLAEVPLTMNVNGTSGPQWAFAPTRDNVFNPFGQDIRSFNFRARAVGPRKPFYDNDNLAVTGWLEGSFELFGRNMYWDAGYSYLDSKINTRGENYINLFNLRRATGASFRDASGLHCGTPGAVIAGCVPYNLFGGPDLGLAAGVITQAEYDAMNNYISYTKNETQENKTKDYFANLSGDIVDLPAGPLGFAVGVEHRSTSFFNNPDALVAGGGSSDNFSEPTSGDVASDEIYAELNIPLLADVPFFKALDLNLAARRTSYDSSGSFGGQNVTPEIGSDTSRKVGLKWQVFDDLLLRGTWSESFRAPSVTDLFAGGGESFPAATDPCNTARFNQAATDQARCQANGVPVGGAVQANSQIRSLVGGNPNLQPEFGTTRTFGLVYSPGFVEGLDFTLDYYNIELSNVIAFRGAQSVLNNCYQDVGSTGGAADAAQQDLFCSFIVRDATGQILDLRQTQFNLDQGEVEGYDFGVHYKTPEYSFGKFDFQWDNTYQTKNDLFGTVGEYNGSPTFRLRSNLTAGWTMGDFDASWTARYYSGLDEGCPYGDLYFEYGITPTELCNNDVANPDGSINRFENRIPAVAYHDLQVGMKLPWNAKVSIGGRNIFGKEPPITRNSFAHSFDGAYDLPGGGFYYMQYSQKF
jgi:iron complex outermembrane receptor protein